MYQLFLDESGECSFADTTDYRYFVISILLVDDVEMRKLKNSSKRVFASIIKKGWKKENEIKAADIYRNKKFGTETVMEYINSVSKLETLKIGYIVIDKTKIRNISLKMHHMVLDITI